MREMVSYGLAHVVQGVFGAGVGLPDEGEVDGSKKRGRRVVVGTYLPPYELRVMEAMSQLAWQPRSKVLRMVVECPLDGAPGGDVVG